MSHANNKITTQTKVTARKQKLTARKQKLTAPKKKLTAPKKKLTAPKKKLTAPKKNSRHQRKTHGTKEKTHGTKEKLTAQEHIFSMRGLETDLKQSNKHGGLNEIFNMSKFCPNCGEEVHIAAAAANYCVSCGGE